MICKKLSLVALSGLTAALSLSAMAQDTTTTTTMDTTTTTSATTSMPMSMEPMMATGTVLRYYTDRTGYVTAADVQTADGVRMVRFSPGMAQRIYSTYPVGGQFSGTLQPSMSMGSARYDVVSLGDTMPAAGMMKPDMTSDVEVLKSEPYIQAGSKMIQFRGKLSSIITDDMGEVLALGLTGVNLPSAASTTGTADASMMADASAAAISTTGTEATPQSEVLVRVPRELRHNSGAQYAGSDRVAPLFKGSDVEVVGYAESPRYGVVSSYGERVAASALVLNGRAIGAIGLPRVKMDRKGTLLGAIKGDSAPSAEETAAMRQGYSTYGTSSSTGMTSDTSMSTSTTTTGGM